RVPARRGLQAARQVLHLASSLDEYDLLIVLLSGGASRLLPLPAEGLTLADKQRTTQLLLRSGATIAEVNTVRKHLSAIKGGRLAAATRASVLTLILSDVSADDLGVIGSGPTAPDRTTFLDAARVLRRYDLWERLPVAVRIHLVEGLAGWRHETPKPRSLIFRRVQHVVVGNNRLAVEAAAKAARKEGYERVVFGPFVTGEAGAVADGKTVERGRRKRIDAARFLRRHDSYTFFKKAGGHIRTGLTGTNVNDVYLLLVRPVSIVP